MDIAMMSIMSNQLKTQDAVGLAVAKLAMNTGKQNAANINEMLKEAVNPNLGRRLDIRG